MNNNTDTQTPNVETFTHDELAAEFPALVRYLEDAHYAELECDYCRGTQLEDPDDWDSDECQECPRYEAFTEDTTEDLRDAISPLLRAFIYLRENTSMHPMAAEWCCRNCTWSSADTEDLVFFTEQSFSSQWVTLYYNCNDRPLAEQLVTTLVMFGLKVEWNGDLSKAIEVDLRN
jgi:hypothetical protein